MDEWLRWATLGVLVTLPAGFVVGLGVDAGHAAAGSGVALLGAVLGVVILFGIKLTISEERERERERQVLREVAERERRGDSGGSDA